MKTKKILSFILVLALIFSMLISTTINVSALGNEVKLLFSQTDNYDFYGYIEVENLAPDKQVSVHYSVNNGQWQDVSASYLTATDSSHEAWYFKVTIPNNSDPQYTANIRYTVRYDVNGQTYWDNNNGNDYYISAGYAPAYPTAVLAKSVVVLQDASDWRGSFCGWINLKDLAYNKDIKVRYTTNDWASYSEVSATYYGSNSSYQTWYFGVTPDPATTQIKFAISYTVNGVTYWDNNLGSNYTIIVPGRVTPER